MEIISGWDVIVDGVDNFPTRYLLNDASVRLQIPVVSASILGFDGQLSVFKPYEGPCYRCLFKEPPPAELAPSCGANGVLGVLPGTMGLLQATEVVKLIVGAGDPAIGRLLLVRRAGGDADRGQGAPRSANARSARATPTRSATRRWACSPTTRRSAPPPDRVPAAMATIKIPPVLRAVGRRRARGQRGRRQRRRVPAGAGRGPPGDRHAAVRRRRASSTATSTSTSTTRTCACSMGSRRRSARATCS